MNPIGDILGGFMGHHDEGLREALKVHVIENGVLHTVFMAYLCEKGVMNIDEFNEFKRRNEAAVRAAIDQKLAGAEAEAFKKWKAENPDKVKTMELMKKLMGIKDEP